jgi:hypothetical protein
MTRIRPTFLVICRIDLQHIKAGVSGAIHTLSFPLAAPNEPSQALKERLALIDEAVTVEATRR